MIKPSHQRKSPMKRRQVKYIYNANQVHVPAIARRFRTILLVFESHNDDDDEEKKITQQHSTLAGVYTVAVVDVDVVAFACVFTKK